MFWNMILGIVSRILLIPIMLKCPKKVALVILGIVYGLCFISTLAVYICGLVWRYGDAGRFASGDDATRDEI